MKTQLSALLKMKSPQDLSYQLERHACVAILLRGSSFDDLEIAFIQRAMNVGDRWSGQLAFPGGKREKYDVTDLDAALRETREEVGIELKDEHLLGRLDDVQARKAGTLLDFYIRPFVFYYPDENHTVVMDPAEVADFFWRPLNDLTDPNRQTIYTLPTDLGVVELPAIHFDREPPLWGLTYMMALDLLRRLTRA